MVSSKGWMNQSCTRLTFGSYIQAAFALPFCRYILKLVFLDRSGEDSVMKFAGDITNDYL